ncbi:MAG: DUF2971 domain-containing protein [Ignavibacteria bacterium]|nr:DUF2971 domain-containing protein [Ignavibacteria bacterium]
MDDKLIDLVVLMVHQAKLPQYIFRYRSIFRYCPNGQIFDTQYFDSIIVNNELWFSKGTEFNDPFDCNIEVDTNNTEDEIRNYISSRMPVGTSLDNINLLVETASSDKDKFNQLVNDAVRKVLEKRGIVCFSKVNDNILLWSHYSDYHKGCVLKFDVLKNPEFFVFPLNVKYQADYPDYNHLVDSPDPVTPLIRTKSCDWKYEDEVRIVKNFTGPHTFKKEALVEIIFGWRTPETEIVRIQKLAADNGYNHIVFKQARLKKRQFGLEIFTI